MKNSSELHETRNWQPAAASMPVAVVREETIAAPAYKRLTLFYVAANALLLAGQLLNDTFSWQDFLLLQWCGITGVLVVYRFNDMIDHSRDFNFNLQHILGNRLNLFVLLQLLFVLLPTAFQFFSADRIICLLLTCTLGVLYSVKLRIGERYYRIKHLFLVKNVLIGLLWGGLIPIGAGISGDAQVLALFLFTSLQVMVGSMIRDIPDVESDRSEGVQTLPVVVGIPATMLLLHLFNAVSLVSAVMVFPETGFVFMLAAIVLWRMFLLVQVRRNPGAAVYTNTLNLATCVLILVALVAKQYGYGH